jgi:hypothetical protein
MQRHLNDVTGRVVIAVTLSASGAVRLGDDADERQSNSLPAPMVSAACESWVEE